MSNDMRIIMEGWRKYEKTVSRTTSSMSTVLVETSTRRTNLAQLIQERKDGTITNKEYLKILYESINRDIIELRAELDSNKEVLQEFLGSLYKRAKNAVTGAGKWFKTKIYDKIKNLFMKAAKFVMGGKNPNAVGRTVNRIAGILQRVKSSPLYPIGKRILIGLILSFCFKAVVGAMVVKSVGLLDPSSPIYQGIAGLLKTVKDLGGSSELADAVEAGEPIDKDILESVPEEVEKNFSDVEDKLPDSDQELASIQDQIKDSTGEEVAKLEQIPEPDGRTGVEDSPMGGHGRSPGIRNMDEPSTGIGSDTHNTSDGAPDPSKSVDSKLDSVPPDEEAAGNSNSTAEPAPDNSKTEQPPEKLAQADTQADKNNADNAGQPSGQPASKVKNLTPQEVELSKKYPDKKSFTVTDHSKVEIQLAKIESDLNKNLPPDAWFHYEAYPDGGKIRAMQVSGPVSDHLAKLAK